MSDTDSQPRSYVMVWLASIILGLALFSAVCVGGFLWVHEPVALVAKRACDEGVKALEDLVVNKILGAGCTVRRELQPDGRVELLVQGDEHVTRLLTAERRFTHRYLYTTTWLGSTKKLILGAEFKAHAGVNLGGGPIRLKLGAASAEESGLRGTGQLFACEQVGEMSVECKNGFWNKITPEEINEVREKFLQDARRYITEQTDLCRVAEENFFSYLHGEQGSTPPRPFAEKE